MGGRRAGNLEAELMWRWRHWWRQWWRQHQNQEFSVHKWVDFVYKCQKYNQRELQRLATGSYRISPHLWHGFQHSCHRNFFDSPRTVGPPLSTEVTPTADDCHTMQPSALASVSYPLASCALFDCPSTSEFCV